MDKVSWSSKLNKTLETGTLTKANKLFKSSNQYKWEEKQGPKE